MGTHKKPDLKDFLTDQLVPFSNRRNIPVSEADSKKRVESRKTKIASYVVMLLFAVGAYAIIMAYDVRIYSLVALIGSIAVIGLCIVLLEILHWFYAVFEEVD